MNDKQPNNVAFNFSPLVSDFEVDVVGDDLIENVFILIIFNPRFYTLLRVPFLIGHVEYFTLELYEFVRLNVFILKWLMQTFTFIN